MKQEPIQAGVFTFTPTGQPGQWHATIAGEHFAFVSLAAVNRAIAAHEKGE